MEKIQFQPNAPVTIALKFATPREQPSQYHDGVDYQYSTVDGKTFYATAALHDRIQGLNVKPREEFTIAKTQDEKKTAWIVERPNANSTAPQDRPVGSNKPGDLGLSHSQDNARVPKLAMDRAVGLFLEIAARQVVGVEQRVGRPVDQVVQALACTMFIESARRGILEFPAELAQQIVADQKLAELQRKPAASETTTAIEFPPAESAWKTRGEMKAVYGQLREALGEVEYFQRLAEFGVSDPGQFRTGAKARQCYEQLVDSIRRAA